jgi:hypothetical protein
VWVAAGAGTTVSLFITYQAPAWRLAQSASSDLAGLMTNDIEIPQSAKGVGLFQRDTGGFNIGGGVCNRP